MLGEPLPGVDAMPCHGNQAWIWDSVLFEVIHPQRDSPFEGNNRSCVLRVSVGKSTLMLTGDIEAAAETELLRQLGTGTEVISMPHHGSRTSSTLPFVAATSPDYVLVSAGHENRFGHPKDDIVRRWKARSSVVLDTSASGAIRMGLCANQAPTLLGTSRDGRQKLWHGSNSAAD
jgi:competence protein ComEC